MSILDSILNGLGHHTENTPWKCEIVYADGAIDTLDMWARDFEHAMFLFQKIMAIRDNVKVLRFTIHPVEI